jgi:hypothetical protein
LINAGATGEELLLTTLLRCSRANKNLSRNESDNKRVEKVSHRESTNVSADISDVGDWSAAVLRFISLVDGLEDPDMKL